MHEQLLYNVEMCRNDDWMYLLNAKKQNHISSMWCLNSKSLIPVRHWYLQFSFRIKQIDRSIAYLDECMPINSVTLLLCNLK